MDRLDELLGGRCLPRQQCPAPPPRPGRGRELPPRVRRDVQRRSLRPPVGRRHPPSASGDRRDNRRDVLRTGRRRRPPPDRIDRRSPHRRWTSWPSPSPPIRWRRRCWRRRRAGSACAPCSSATRPRRRAATCAPAQAGLDVRFDNSAGTLHHKLLLIDGRIVATGSYNFTRSAEQANDENVVILRRSGDAAALLQAEFQRLYQAGSP